MARLFPDLAREGSNGGLAAGAGDGDHGFGLAREDMRGEPRQREPRILDEEYLRRRRVDRSTLRGDDGRGTAPRSIGGVGRAVGLAAGDRHEDHAGHDLARIGSHPGDLGRGGTAAFGAEQTGEIVELHTGPVVKTGGYGQALSGRLERITGRKRP